MIWPLVEFGGGFFFALLAIFAIAELAMFHNGEETPAIVVFFLFVAGVLALSSPLPTLSWHYLIVYVAGAFVWVPTYWYLTLLRNRRRLLKADDYGSDAYGVKRDGKWLPKHPDNDALVANGIMWFLAAPVYLANDWINWIIDLFSGLMNKVQSSLAVDAKGK